jgi:hypothetical protein
VFITAVPIIPTAGILSCSRLYYIRTHPYEQLSLTRAYVTRCVKVGQERDAGAALDAQRVTAGAE